MAKRNGGIIGPDNVPAGPLGAAGGVWRLEDAFNYQKAGLWPVVLGYQIPNSCRFNAASSDSLTRTLTTPTNNKIWTFSTWVKRGLSSSASERPFFDASVDGNNRSQVMFDSGDVLRMFNLNGGSVDVNITTTQVFRDFSAWYHIILSVDSTQATASDRLKFYVNGTQITSFSASTYPSLNSSFKINSAILHCVGKANAGGSFYDGYMAETYLIDGQQLTPSSFGETDATTGIWIPKAYTGTYGTNGFYLNFANSGDLGNDVSGNNNDFTVNNLTSVDQSYDSPTNNFCTANPLINVPSASYANGNLTITDGNNSHKTFYSTFGVSTGKWYWEAQATGGTKYTVGLSNILNQSAYQQVSGTNLIVGSDASSYVAGDAIGWYFSTLYKNGATVASGLSTIVTNDIMMVAIDCDAGKIYFGKNGTWRVANSTTFNSALNDTTFTTGQAYVPAFSLESCSWNLNFGYPSFSIASGNADANGFGNFEYAVPSGYYALCSKNLALYG